MSDADSAPLLRVLLLPGWHNSGPAHWQSRWEHLQGDQRVEQDDWAWPKRGDWMARLEDVLLQSDQPAVLVAHSLGCHLAAAWASHTKNASRVRAALLVAPPDTDRCDVPPQLSSWRPVVDTRLPFMTTVVASSNDPYCSAEKAAHMAAAWGSELLLIGPCGHINADSGLADWPFGRSLLQALIAKLR
jgi:uncharacterized protein